MNNSPHDTSGSSRRGRGQARLPRGLAPALIGTALAVIAQGPARADANGGLLDALEATQPLVNVRLRSEGVGQSGKVDSAEAVTVRGRFGFETGSAWGTSLLAEGVALTPLDSHYNSTVNGKTRYPVVADPEDYGLDRLQLENTSLPQTTVVVGRSRINLDDQRFIGSVNWRQLEQTFDAAQVINRSIPDVTVDLTYLNRVNRVFGNRSPQGTYRGNNYLSNVALDTPLGKLVGFAYLLDFDIDPMDSTATYGVRFAGKRRIGVLTLGYSASYASQRQRANNPLRFQDDYWAAQLTAGVRGVTAGAGIEVLGGDGVKGFTTPLATLHAFQGWADLFLTTPPNGVADRYGSVGWSGRHALGFDSMTASVVYHDFRSARLDLDYGSEVDGMIKARWQRFTLIVAYGDYSAREFATDTRKLWAEVDYIL